ncbi:1,4-dihydroxy-2-naphthoate octaprenyltransferase [bacterium BMS3Bbin02]|nr:1,4-dihydroxy-2-naphthoate octaprenyltransferase [bacterium BMS3Bbin02]
MNPWLLAARPPTLWAAVAPVLVGSSLAVRDNVFRADVFVVTTITAVLIQVAVNFANDVGDGVKGTDNPDRIGPPRAVALGLITPGQMWRGVAVVLGLAALGGLYLTWVAGWPVIVIGVVSIIASFGYTNGPRPYGYLGLGELFVFVFFGLVATIGSRFVHDATWQMDAVPGAVAMGFLATAILVANNVRDIATDQAAGKRTLAVRLGRTRSVWFYTALFVGTSASIALGVRDSGYPSTALAAALLSLTGVWLARRLSTATTGPTLIAILKGTARLQLAVAVVLAAALAV